MQEVAPLAEYFPAGQFIQNSLFMSVKVPPKHIVQDELPGILTYPTVQVEQRLAPREEYCPLKQGVHVSEVVLDPPVQLYPASTIQLLEHPFPSIKSLSSHCSPGILRPSPQIGEQTELVINKSFIQFHPVSTFQEASHPSPGVIFPSSQVSTPTIYPSFHCSIQVSAVVLSPPDQCHPFISPVQEELQPFRFEVFPSSQNSVGIFLPSPHIAVQVDAVRPALFTQVHPTSI